MHTSPPAIVAGILFVAAVGQVPAWAADSSGTPDLQVGIRRSKRDYVVYTPKSADGSTFDNGNEHFLVFDGPDGELMAVWTQSTAEGAGDHRIMFSCSKHEGVSWAQPKRLAGSSAATRALPRGTGTTSSGIRSGSSSCSANESRPASSKTFAAWKINGTQGPCRDDDEEMSQLSE